MSGRNYKVAYPHQVPKKTNGKPFTPKKYNYRYHDQETIYKNEWRVSNYYPFYITQSEDYTAMFLRMQRNVNHTVTGNGVGTYGNYGYLHGYHMASTKLANEMSDINSIGVNRTLESAEVEQKEKLIEHYQAKISKLHKKQFTEIEKFNKIIKIIENEIADYIEKCPEKLV